MARRTGATLIEVLVAIFVMSIGIIALLTLFPLGALSMAEALKNDRCAACAAMASGLANSTDLRTDMTVRQAMWGITDSDIATPATVPAGFGSLLPDGPGYPIFVDPLGTQAGFGTLGASGASTPGIARSSVSFITSPPMAPSSWSVPSSAASDRYFSLLDDMTFGTNGVPPSTSLNRPNRYTWACMLRRPRSNNQSLVDLWVVVYFGRPLGSGIPGETVYAATGNQGDNTVTLAWNGGTDKPAIRRNTWLLDVSYDGTNLVHGDFYRAVSSTETGTNTAVELEVPLKKGSISQFVVMETVAEVFYRGSGVQP